MLELQLIAKEKKKGKGTEAATHKLVTPNHHLFRGICLAIIFFPFVTGHWARGKPPAFTPAPSRSTLEVSSVLAPV